MSVENLYIFVVELNLGNLILSKWRIVGLPPEHLKNGICQQIIIPHEIAHIYKILHAVPS